MQPSADPSSDLLVLLHGRGGDEADLLPIAREVAPGARVLAPRAPVPYGAGYAWARPDDRVADGEGLGAAAGAVLARADEIEPAPRRVLLLGFSQGAGVAAELLRSRPGAFAATALLSGFVPRPEALDEGVAAVRPRVFWGRGAEDPLFDVATLDAASRWLQRHTALTARVYPLLGHGVSEEELADVAAFLR